MKKIILLLIVLAYNNQEISAQTTQKYLIKNIASNNGYNNQGVSFFDDDFVIYSTQKSASVQSHTRKSKRKKKVSKKLLPENLDFYFGTISEDGDIVNIQKLPNDINSELNEKGLCFDSNQEIVYFSRENYIKNSDKKHFELFRGEVLSPGSWRNIKKLPFNDEKTSIMYPSLTEDGKTLYFTSNKSGSYNIYKVKILSDWGFGNPEKLSNKINSSTSDETSPFIDGNTLYFSSNKKGGLGGFDIYSIDLSNPNAKAKRLEEPVNSNTNDYCFIKNKSGKGYFTSNRASGKGKEDVYYFEQLIKEENFVKNDKTVKKIIVTKDTLIKNESAFNFQRRTSYDKKTETKEIIVEESQYTNEKNIKKGDHYSKCQMEFDKINNIYFDYSEYYIRDDAAVELDKVIRVMRLCPEITLLASSYTDSRASKAYNLKLSQQRSSSVVKYLLTNGGFSPDRIKAVGYGEERLANRCSDGVKCTEKEHQINRRTHFEIKNY